MKKSLDWAVIGTGGIARDFTQALERSSRVRVVNVVGSSPEKSLAFARRWDLPRAAPSLSELLRDPEVEAVYVATPHPLHEEQTLACIDAGKHVLCEKPLCVDSAAAERVIEEARRREVFLMEGFMYRCHPLLAEVIERVKGGAIGRLRHLRADFGFRAERDPDHRLFAPRLGGGAVLDVGGYPVSLARLLAGLVAGRPFAEPARIDAAGYRGPWGEDELATALLGFESGFTAQVSCAVFHELGTRATLFGDEGRLVLPNPWIPRGNRQSLLSDFTVERYGEPPERVEVRTERPTYALEAELVADTLPGLQPPWPAMTGADTLGNLRVMEAWRNQIGPGSPAAQGSSADGP